jgi:hypothetical protein
MARFCPNFWQTRDGTSVAAALPEVHLRQPTTVRSTEKSTKGQRVRKLLARSAGFLSGLLLGIGVPKPWQAPGIARGAQPSADQSVSEMRAIASPQKKKALRAKAVGPSGSASLAASESEEEEETSSDNEQQASQAKQVLFGRIAALELFGDKANFPPERVANEMLAYQTGYADGIRYAAPQVLPHLAKQVEDFVCKDQTDAKLIVAARLVRSLPELASERSFECLLRHDGPETSVTWAALDAWKSSDVGEIPAIQRLRETSQHAGTLRRLSKSDPNVSNEKGTRP